MRDLATLLQDIASGTNTSQAKTYRMQGEPKVFHAAFLTVHEVKCETCNEVTTVPMNVLFEFTRGENNKHFRSAHNAIAKDILRDNPAIPRNIARVQTTEIFCEKCFLEESNNA